MFQVSRFRLPGVYLLLGFLIFILVGAAVGWAETQKAGPKQIAESDRTKRKPRPDAPKVCIEYTLDRNPQTGDVKLKAKFTNKDAAEKHFVFCQMVGTKTESEDVQASCEVFYDADQKKVRCEKSTRTFSSPNRAWHFGCRDVSLKGNGTAEKDYGSGQHDSFKKQGDKLPPLFVTYADYISLPAGTPMFDPDKDCPKDCFGKDKVTGLGPNPGSGVQGDWYLPQLPFADPYIAWQPLCGQPSPPEYRSLFLTPGVPSNFPATIPQLPRNVPAPVPDSYAMDLNLFDLYTMSPDSPSTQAALSVNVIPSVPGVFLTSPPEFDSQGQQFVFTIPGGGQEFGTITIRRPVRIAEGASAELNVVVNEPDTPSRRGDGLFTQKGTFIQDTSPPVVDQHSLLFDSANQLRVEVAAHDTTTSPIAADFWFSADGGATWNSRNLDSLSSLFDTQQARRFGADIGVFPSNAHIMYFLTVQDQTFNMNFFGVGNATPSLSCDVNHDGQVDIRDISLIFSARGQTASPGDTRDVDRDCQITVNDARVCVLRCTKPNCAI